MVPTLYVLQRTLYFSHGTEDLKGQATEALPPVQTTAQHGSPTTHTLQHLSGKEAICSRIRALAQDTPIWG